MFKVYVKTLALVSLFFSLSAFSAELPFCKNTAYDWSKDSKATARGNEGYASYSARVKRNACRKPWTILIYMAADNDLTPYAFWDIHDMERTPKQKAGTKPAQVGSTDKIDIVVQLDTSQSDELRRIHLFQSKQPSVSAKGLTFFETYKEKQILSPVVNIAKDTNKSTDAAKLKGFLEWGIRNYPSQNLMVVVWGHGQGWTAKRLKKNPGDAFENRGFGGLAFDEAQKSYLSIPDLSKVLRSVAYELNRPIDVYASDACLMQMVEVAYELGSPSSNKPGAPPTARYIVGSTQVQSYLGLPYAELVSEINSGNFYGEKKLTKGDLAKDEGYLVAKMIPRLLQTAMDPKRGSQGKFDPEAYKTLTSSAISTYELIRPFPAGSSTLGGLAPSMMKLGQSLSKYLSEKTTRKTMLQFAIQDTPAFQGGAQDLKVFLGILDQQLLEEAFQAGRATGARTYTPAAKALSGVIYETNQAINRTVLSYAIGSSYAVDEYENRYGVAPTGLSVWLPSGPDDYKERIADFGKSRFYKILSNNRSPWRGWITSTFSGGF